MIKNCEEVKMSIYAGMSIFDLIKDYELSDGKQPISLEDKKYLSLYLGIINTENSIIDYLKDKNILITKFINFKFLNQVEYLKIYNDYFVDVLDEINFDSLESNLNYLLNKKVVEDFNKTNKFYFSNYLNKCNKQLVK